MTRVLLTGLLCVLCASVVNPAPAQTPFPMVTHCTPVAVQRGTTAEVAVEGQMNFAGVSSALFDGPGLTAEVVPAPPAKDPKARVAAVKLKVTADADAPLGPREFRLVSPLGLSTVGQLVVVADPVVVETTFNNTTVTATPLPVPGVASGRIEAAEDVDFYKVRAEAGQTLAVEVYGARLQDKIHDLQKHLDPIVTLFDAQGRELAANDDYYFADPLLTYTVPKTGDYFIQVRDAKFDGDPRWAYALLVTARPYAAHVFPLAGNPGQELIVEPVGPAAQAAPRVPFTVPTDLGLRTIQLPINGALTNPTGFVVSPLPQVTEQEPNDTPDAAQRLSLPCGVNGRIGRPRDLDYFAFTGEKGKAVRFEVKARRFGTPLQSALDSVLEVLDPKGRLLAANDDDPATGKDALLTFTPPADGDFLLRLRDLNSKGGPAFVYYLEADHAKPDFALRCDGARAHVGPGGRAAWYVHVVRQSGFAGPVKVDVHRLPPGVTASPLTIPPAMTQGLVVLTADQDAKVGAAAAVQVVGTGQRPDGSEVAHVAAANEEIYLPGGGRGRFDVALHAVAVTGPSDVADVKVTPAAVTLKPGGEVRLDVTVERRADFDKGVVLDVALRHLEQVIDTPLPPGVTVDYNKSKTLLGNGNKGHVVLKAAPDAAPVEAVPVSVVAYVSINFVVKVGYSSPVIPLTVQKKD
jgi:Bacterial pre-peptidase C-terminal domain